MLGPRRGPLSQSDLTTVSIVTDQGVLLPLETSAECDVLREAAAGYSGFLFAQMLLKYSERIQSEFYLKRAVNGGCSALF